MSKSRLAARIERSVTTVAPMTINFMRSQRRTAGRALDRMAEQIHQQSNRLYKIGKSGHRAGQLLEDAADYVRPRSSAAVVDGMIRSLKSSPTTALVVLAACCGVGWHFTRR
jgi:hypothetical protein